MDMNISVSNQLIVNMNISVSNQLIVNQHRLLFVSLSLALEQSLVTGLWIEGGAPAGLLSSARAAVLVRDEGDVCSVGGDPTKPPIILPLIKLRQKTLK